MAELLALAASDFPYNARLTFFARKLEFELPEPSAASAEESGEAASQDLVDLVDVDAEWASSSELAGRRGARRS